MTVNKEKFVNDILKLFYNAPPEPILLESEIKDINNYYAKNFKNSSILDFCCKTPQIANSIYKLESGKCEIEKQLTAKAGLQGGILTECNFSQTLAKMLRLKNCTDLEKTTVASAPANIGACLPFLNRNKDRLTTARYLYHYSDSNLFLAQYGNPIDGDADIIDIKSGNIIHLEYKENNAKAGEYDLDVGDKGKLLLGEKISKMFPAMQYCIDDFNNHTTLFDSLGSNYKIQEIDGLKLVDIVKQYFKNNSADLLISSVNNEMVAIKPKDLSYTFSDGTNILTTKGSEIRTTGRNHTTIKNIKYFKECTKDICTFDGNKCKLKKTERSGYGFVKERGGTGFGRYKINYMFFVRTEDITEDDNYIYFNVDDVRQTKPTISMHLQIATTRERLKELYTS